MKTPTKFVFYAVAALIVYGLCRLINISRFSKFDFEVVRKLENRKTHNKVNSGFLKLGQWLTELKLKTSVNTTHSQKIVLLYNWQKWFPLSSLNRSFANCDMSNCAVTTNRRFVKTADAVIFHLTQENHLLRNPPIKRKERNADQPWIAMYFESPLHIGLKTFISDVWTYTFNWSMSYRFDADITVPYGAIMFRRNHLYKNYSAVLYRKKKMAAWIVSNCYAKSGREKLVKGLQDHGINVDIFGKCGNKNVKNEYFLEDYKFYFAFENSLCEDYITEKFFSRFNYDVILVTYGGANYGRLLPHGTFVNVADFHSIQQLAVFLKKLANDNAMYGAYIKEKDKFIAIEPHHVWLQYGLCQLCTKVNEIEKNRRVIKDIARVITESDCLVYRNVYF